MIDIDLARRQAGEEAPAEEQPSQQEEQVEQTEQVAEEQNEEVVAEETQEEQVEEQAEEQQEQPAEETDPYKDLDLSKVKVGDVPVTQLMEERQALLKEKEQLTQEKEQIAKRIAELESDPWLANFLDEYKSGGDVEKYLAAKVDWTKKNDVDVLRTTFEKQNSDLDGDLLNIAFRREMRNKYGIDPFDQDVDIESEDYKYAQALMKRDANKSRAAFNEEQTKYSIPKKKVENTPQPNVEDFKKKVLEDTDVKSIMEKKLLQMDVKSESGDTFNYELESAEPIVEMMWDEAKFWNLFLNNGKVDLKKAAKVFAYAKDPSKFESQIFDWGKKSATEAVVKQKKNISGTQQKAAPNQAKDDVKGLAKAVFSKW